MDGPLYFLYQNEKWKRTVAERKQAKEDAKLKKEKDKLAQQAKQDIRKFMEGGNAEGELSLSRLVTSLDEKYLEIL